jgi:putative SOS response-associated peptidase YedK
MPIIESCGITNVYHVRITINAHSLTVMEKPKFRAAIKTRRCSMPTDERYKAARSRRAHPPDRPESEEAMILTGLEQLGKEFG